MEHPPPHAVASIVLCEVVGVLHLFSCRIWRRPSRANRAVGVNVSRASSLFSIFVIGAGYLTVMVEALPRIAGYGYVPGAPKLGNSSPCNQGRIGVGSPAPLLELFPEIQGKRTVVVIVQSPEQVSKKLLNDLAGCRHLRVEPILITVTTKDRISDSFKMRSKVNRKHELLSRAWEAGPAPRTYALDSGGKFRYIQRKNEQLTLAIWAACRSIAK